MRFKRRGQLRKDRRPEEEMEALFREELEHEKKMFAAEKHFGQVGAFEERCTKRAVIIVLRSTASCFRAPIYFCKVCREAIERVIKMYSRPS